MAKRICSVDGCNNPHLAKGFCRKCYDEHNRPESIRKVNLVRPLYLKVSKELFIKHGYMNTSIRMIGEALGYNTSNIYTYWKTKEDLFDEITECVDGLGINIACEYPVEYAMLVEKRLSEDGTLIKKLSELSPELLVAML